MRVNIGDSIPDLDVMIKDEDGVDTLNLKEFTQGRKIVLFIVPGAFTPTCSAKHVPSFITHYDALRAAGVDEIACLSVNDAHVMKVWGEDQEANGKVTMLADVRGTVADALGVLVDMGPVMGVRAGRSAFVLEDGVFTHIFIEEPAVYDVSSAEHVLEALQAG